MSLPKFALENHQFASIIVLILVLIGIVSFMTMPRSEDPQISPAGTSVYAVYPGANPADVEKLFSQPIEEVLNELDDIKELKSISRTGYGQVDIEFISGSDGDEKYSDVVQKVNSIRSNLPNEIVDIQMIKWTINDVKVLQYALVSENSSYAKLENEAEALEDLLKTTPGVKKIETWAYPEQEVRIQINMERLANMRIGINQLIGAIQTSSVNIPGGKLDLGGRQFNIQTSGSFEKIEDIENIIVNTGIDKPIYLKDIADIYFDYEDPSHIARFNGKNTVFVTASQKSGTNIFDVTDQIKEKAEIFRSTLPKNIILETVFDQSESVSNRLTGFFFNLLQGLILVGIIIIFAVGLRASLIVMLVIPVSIFIGIGLLDLSNYGLQQMSIAGLVIALGLLVDNAIVVTENIARFIKEGFSKFDAALRGTSQIAWAVTSSTITTILAFVPMILMADITGEFIRSMPLTVIFTLLASLWVSITITPYLSKKFMRDKDEQRESILRKQLDKIISGNYRKTLDYALNRPKFVIFLSIFIFILSLSLFPLIGVSFFPKAEKPQFIINVNLPEGTSIERTNEVARYVESVLKEKSEIVKYATNVGHGNPRIYYNVLSKRNANNHAQFLIETEEYQFEKFNNLLDDLRNEFNDYPGASIEVKDFIQGPPVEAPIAIKIIGDNLSVLKDISLNAEQIFKNTEGTLNIFNPLSTTKSDIHININREKAAMYGVPLAEIDRAVRAQITGLIISNFRDEQGKEFNIVVRGEELGVSKLSHFDKIYVPSVRGSQIPLKQLASIEFKSTPLEISHYELTRTVTVTADVKTGFLVNDVTNQIIEKLNEYNWPKGYSFYVGGELASQQESFGGMARALIIAIVGIFGVLVLQFKSYSQPLIVFSAVPLAIIGSIIALLITGYSFSFTAFVGLTSLVGIVINNSIILVDYSNQLRDEGKAIIEAVKLAGEVRFIPIILTTATTIGGLLPLTLGGGTMWAPMGWSIIGGLIASTFLTLVVVPVLYKVFTKAS